MKLTIPGELTDLNTFLKAVNNNLYAGANIKRQETNRVAQECVACNLEAQLTPVKLHIAYYMKNTRKDLDNVAYGKKYLLDGLVLAGVLYDDSYKWVRGWTEEFLVDPASPRVEVTFKKVI